ncbi:MAG TPA: hypothetical protein DEF47_20765 [Herpetosiphon sp.]|uniref:Uncharacterized protein n=1 Tax=Herpetosiphon aurantiacus (strain ATCC 23779 / DSM 785 / 114-95) TaxID=316274 RepID=A9B7P2_HERA2|nr:hypothetical protein [Herpetosiphon sp.]ABX04420.1 hypothetical protein Haur_1777 [Herpetosiphon aurantiacus DSM 785]HBW52327.1 hypothetical protein [Herpetosiphon sp.]
MNKPESSLITLGTAIQADFSAWLDGLTSWLPSEQPASILADDWQTELALAAQLQQLSAWADGLSSGLVPQLIVGQPRNQTQVAEPEPTNLAAWQPALVENNMPARPSSDLFQPPVSAMSSQTQATKVVVRPELHGTRQVLAAAPLRKVVPLQAGLADHAATNQLDRGLPEVVPSSTNLDVAPNLVVQQAATQPSSPALAPITNQTLPIQTSPIKGLADFAQLWQGADHAETAWLAEVAQPQAFEPALPSQALPQAVANQSVEPVQPSLPSQSGGQATSNSTASAWQQAATTQSFNQPNSPNQAADQPEATLRNFNLAEIANAQRTWITPALGNQAAASATHYNIPAPNIHPTKPALELPATPASPPNQLTIANPTQTPSDQPPPIEAIQQAVASQTPNQATEIQREQLVDDVLAALTQALQREYLRFYSD